MARRCQASYPVPVTGLVVCLSVHLSVSVVIHSSYYSIKVDGYTVRVVDQSKLFPLRVDPILGRLHCTGKETESHKIVSL